MQVGQLQRIRADRLQLMRDARVKIRARSCSRNPRAVRDYEPEPVRRGKIDATLLGASGAARLLDCPCLRFSRRIRANVFLRSVLALDV
jgi:hypothetical protein